MSLSGRKKYFAAVFFCSFLGSSCDKLPFGMSKDAIPVIGLDEDGKAVSKMIPRRGYVKKLGGMIDGIHNEVVDKLDRRETQHPWQLTRFTVGLDFVVEIGWGPMKWEFETPFELRFEKL